MDPEYRQSSARRELEIHRAAETGTGVHVKDRSTGHVAYYAGHYVADRYPDVVLYGGYDSTGPRLAQADFIQHSRDFEISIGDSRFHATDQSDTVRCAGGGLLHEPMYRFEVKSNDGTVRKLYFQKDHKFFAGIVHNPPLYYRLIDEETEGIRAVYNENKTGSSKTLKGVLSFWHHLDETAEIACLTVLLSLKERFRRHLRHKGFVGSPLSDQAK
ncbi:hypothetical protein DOTSEDRAFT_28181 [Dothistroma septosporum NZE10]|uniref:Uncharacterized protein n=1 Tax=Dothistroma septosporum (strain NZE10 / CBS 128990) TaxID=675120 RepID=N1PG60_DOTSN|nr:hypothetical protein DOTSEDRAFT_28181 [Dothistroma septosporum NZE10]